MVPVTTVDQRCPDGFSLGYSFVLPILGPVCRKPGEPDVAPTNVTVVRDTTVDANYYEQDTWTNGCSDYESRVPPGLLPPDGQGLPAGATATSPGPVDKCERRKSICGDADRWTTINDVNVYRACWQYSNTFDCVTRSSASDCDQPRFGTCTPSLPVCIDTDQFIQPPVCTVQRTDFDCLVKPAVYQDVTNCQGQTYCEGGKCFSAGNPADTDFARTVSILEAGREAGKYLDQSALRVFKGEDNRCVKKLFGLVNCCNRGGVNIGAFSNWAVLSAALGQARGVVGSTYTYDALFASGAPDITLQGFELLFGSGGSSALAGFLGGDLAVGELLGALVPGPWTIAMMVIQYSGLLSCKEKEQVTAMKRDGNLCVELGEYCSRRLPIIRTCMEQTRSFCCFNSRLAKVINVQGRAQLGRGFGSAENPDCSGFSVAELQSLDFSRMDLREFYADIVPKDADLSALVGAINSRIGTCVYGQGKCGP